MDVLLIITEGYK